MSIAVSLVQSRLDYANSLLYQTSSYNISKLQRVQNTAARLVLRNSKISSFDALSQLHWLPINKRIDFKIATVTYKLLSTQQPAYLRSLINYETRAYATRSTEQRRLRQPFLHTVTGQRAFSSASPCVYNAIPLNIRLAPSIESFKRQLKTFYCKTLSP